MRSAGRIRIPLPVSYQWVDRAMNRILSITRSTIPYVKELNELTGGIIASVLMQQLDYWFDKKPDGFYKFLEPSTHSAYHKGDSWCEELGISKAEFRTAFDAIGARHTSRAAFIGAKDPFAGKFYASYIDKRTNLTMYYRNHALVDYALNELIRWASMGKPEGYISQMLARFFQQTIDFKADSESESQRSRNSISQIQKGDLTDSETESLEIRNMHLTKSSFATSEMQKPDFPYTDTTQKLLITTTTPVEPDSQPSSSSSFDNNASQSLRIASASTVTSTVENSTVVNTTDLAKLLQDLIYPALNEHDLVEIRRRLVQAKPENWQLLLDELEGQRRLGFTKGPINFFHGLVLAERRGELNVRLSADVRNDRDHRAATAAALAASAAPRDVEQFQFTKETLDNLPPGVRARTESALLQQRAARGLG